MSLKSDEIAKRHYLTKFERENAPIDLFSDGAKACGENIVTQLKKEGMTYDDAYASLQYAYNLIRFESNFLRLEK